MAQGLDAQWMLKEESTWGTYVAVDRAFEFQTEAMENAIERSEFTAIKATNRVIQTGRWVAGKVGAGGEIASAVYNKGQGILWKHALGNIATTTPTNGVLTRDHTATPANLLGKGLSIQIGKPFYDSATLKPFSYLGCKVGSWSMACAVGDFASLNFTFVAKNEDTAQTLGTYTPPTGLKVLSWSSGAFTIAGLTVPITEFSIAGNNQLDEDNYQMFSTSRLEPQETQLREYTGSVTARFDSTNGMTLYNRFVNGTEAALVITLQGDLIEGSLYYSTILTANVRFDGETPKVGDPGEMRLPLAFKVVDTGSSSLSIVYRTTDTTP